MIEIVIGFWGGAVFALLIFAPESFGRFADDFWGNVHAGIDWLLGRR